jgi:hypothetical protein
MRAIGLFTHDLYVLGMKKEDIHRFGFMQTEWYDKLNFREIHLKLLRIKTESDFSPPNGPLYKAYWGINTMCANLNVEGILTMPSRNSGPPQKTILAPVPKRPTHPPLSEIISAESSVSYTKKSKKSTHSWRKQKDYHKHRRYDNPKDRRYPRARNRGNWSSEK